MRRLLTYFLLVHVCIVSMAQAISSEDAFQKAQAFLQTRGRQAETIPASTAANRRAANEAAYYVFNATGQQGFVIISGDERTDAVLGYADEGAFDESRLPAHVSTWLDSYAEQISMLTDQPSSQVSRRTAVHDAVAPIVTVKWGQESPYNNQCPTISSYKAPTGCVATALAQIMHSFKYPTTSVQAIPGYTDSDGHAIAATTAGVIDWDNMLTTYTGSSTTTQQDAVARLMRLCGQAAKMNYSVTSSGAFADNVGPALSTYFGYNTNARNIDRADYSATAWDETIYQEIAEGRPVLYNGYATGGGHAFVCDGYDGNGYYHVNWGWEGMYNGYYKLSVLNPDGGGTGSSGTADGYSVEQCAVIGIQPANDNQDSRHLTYYGLELYNSQTIRCSFYNRTGTETKFDYGFAYRKSTDQNYQYRTSSSTIAPITSDGSTSGIAIRTNVASLGLSDGTWYFYPYSKVSSSLEGYIHGNGTVYAEVVKSGSNYTITLHPIPDVTVTKMENAGNGIAGLSQEVQVTLQNNGEEYYQDLYLFATRSSSLGNYTCLVAATVEAGQTETINFYFTPSTNGTWHLYMADNKNGEGAQHLGDVTINAAPTTTTSLSLTKVQATGNTITATIKNNGSSGYYREAILLIYQNTTKITQVSCGNLSLEQGTSADVNFYTEDIEAGKTYRAYLFAYKTHASSASAEQQGSGYKIFTVQTPTAIEQVKGLTADKPFDVYSLTGRLLRRQATTTDGLPAGIYIVNNQKISIQ